MQVSKDERRTEPFVLSERDLRRLVDRLVAVADLVSFEAECADGLNRLFAGLDELLAYENPARKAIRQLWIRASSSYEPTRVRLRMENDFRINISIAVEGEESVVIGLIEYIDEFLAGLRPWYAVLARRDYALIITVAQMCLGLGAVALLVLTFAVSPDVFRRMSPQRSLPGFTLGLALAGVLYGIGAGLNRLRNVVFPMGVFLIGQGVKRHADKDIIRTVVILGFFISVVGSVAATLIFLPF